MRITPKFENLEQAALVSQLTFLFAGDVSYTRLYDIRFKKIIFNPSYGFAYVFRFSDILLTCMAWGVVVLLVVAVAFFHQQTTTAS
jgi:hypothetical protein